MASNSIYVIQKAAKLFYCASLPSIQQDCSKGQQAVTTHSATHLYVQI
ncbi:MAG TPA: hypothetical protein V6D48_10410 [Oculatellaceae cyanobacterium]